jgi:hypothetical protein
MKTIFLWLKLLTIFTLTTFLTTTLDAVDITLDNTIVKINGDGNSVTCHNDDIYRLGTLTFFKGQAFDILIKVLVEENEADQLKNFQSPFIERPCIGVKNGLIESILRDTNDENGNNDANDKAYMDLELSIVKKGTLERMTVDKLQFSGFDLDRSANRSASDDIYISTPGRAYIDNNNSLITIE